MGLLYNNFIWHHLSPLPSGGLSPFQTFLQHKHWFKGKVWPALHKVLILDQVTLLRTTLPSVKGGTAWCINNSTRSKSLKWSIVICRANPVIQSFLIVHYSAQHINQCKYDQCSLGECCEAVKGDIEATYFLAEDVPNQPLRGGNASSKENHQELKMSQILRTFPKVRTKTLTLKHVAAITGFITTKNSK